MWPVFSCVRFLCNRARELLKRDALEALDVAVLVEIAHHVLRCALCIYELEKLAFIARVSLSLRRLPSSMPAPSFSLPVLSLCKLPLRLSFCDFLGRASSLGFCVRFYVFSRLSFSLFKLKLYIFFYV